MLNATQLYLRIFALGFIFFFAIVRLFFLPPFQQVPSKQLNINLANMLDKVGATEIIQKQQTSRSDLKQIQFRLPTCAAPLLALQALTLEDITAVLNIAAPNWVANKVHVYYLGHQLALSDRLGLKLTAVTGFVRYRLGLSADAPSAYLYLIVEPIECNSASILVWPGVWRTAASSGSKD